jgi:dienelactone hydrolase
LRVNTQAFTYEHDGLSLTGQIARPPGDGPHPAVLVMHSALGLDDLVCRRASDLAELGYVAVATDMYGAGRQLTKEQAGTHFVGLLENSEQLRGRLAATFDAVRGRAEVDGARVAAIGFCFGGQCALELARSGAEVRSVVSFHGLLRTASRARRGAVTAKVLSITGVKDPYVPKEDLQASQREMTEAEVDWQVTVYGEGRHAFTRPDIGDHDVAGTAYDPLFDHLSWAQATTFLAATLRGLPHR